MNTTILSPDQALRYQMARDAKEVRDAEGYVNAEQDAQLARFEAGNFGRNEFVAVDEPQHQFPQSSNNNSGSGRPTAPLATEAQVRFLVSLSTKVQGTGNAYLAISEANAAALTKREASDKIGELKAATDDQPKPKAQTYAYQPPKREAADEGLYFYEGTIVKVQTNRAGTHRYAKRYDTHNNEYVYAAGLQFKVTETLTLAQATEIASNANHSTEDGCILCGKKLTDEYSMSVRIGKICREKF